MHPTLMTGIVNERAYALRAAASERRRGRFALLARSNSRRASARRVRATRVAHA